MFSYKAVMHPCIEAADRIGVIMMTCNSDLQLDQWSIIQTFMRIMP